jgi:hypothetical protein
VGRQRAATAAAETAAASNAIAELSPGGLLLSSDQLTVPAGALGVPRGTVHCGHFKQQAVTASRAALQLARTALAVFALHSCIVGLVAAAANLQWLSVTMVADWLPVRWACSRLLSATLYAPVIQCKLPAYDLACFYALVP